MTTLEPPLDIELAVAAAAFFFASLFQRQNAQLDVKKIPSILTLLAAAQIPFPRQPFWKTHGLASVDSRCHQSSSL